MAVSLCVVFAPSTAPANTLSEADTKGVTDVWSRLVVTTRDFDAALTPMKSLLIQDRKLSDCSTNIIFYSYEAGNVADQWSTLSRLSVRMFDSRDEELVNSTLRKRGPSDSKFLAALREGISTWTKRCSYNELIVSRSQQIDTLIDKLARAIEAVRGRLGDTQR